ncbi:MAG: hypothetical protein LQ345_002213 [Seirophora villosa]|nr:MAG: hypothetical protein LQ345_002213 [Seirophora villosa]
MLSLIAVLPFAILAPITLTTASDLPVKLEVRAALNSRSANIHLSQPHASLYPFTVTYGACHDSVKQHEQHHTVSEVIEPSADRLIWLLPSDINDRGCLSAWSSTSELVGRSRPLKVSKDSRQWTRKRHLDAGTRLSKRASIPMTNESGIDASGPWFDGVAVLEDKQIGAVDATQAKAKPYLEGGPSDYQYQDMGPQRFPESIQYAGSNETIPVNDMKMVFQLGDIMNQLNAGDANATVKFIPWIQTSPNGLSYFSGFKKANGLPPTVTESEASENLTSQSQVNPVVGNITDQIAAIACEPETMAAAAKNVFAAHKIFIDTGLGGLGGDDWSEFAYFHNYLKYDLNATDQAINAGAYGGRGAIPARTSERQNGVL